MSKEAMKLALEALEQARGALAYVAVGNAETNPNLARSTCSHGIYAIDKVEPALREALAEQPAQQEPVAYWIPKAEQFCIASPSGRPFAKAWEPLYTSPPAQRKPLTDDEIESINVRLAGSRDLARLFARAIEAAHGITGETQ